MSLHISVAVGVIQNAQHDVLITQRPNKDPYGGYWEFPGGKVENREIPRQALTRELQEELGIEVQQAVPLIRVYHDYGERHVRLDVWRIIEYKSQPHGKEGQAIAWIPVHRLMDYPLLPANKPIVTAISLPQHYIITPANISELDFYQYIKNILQKKYSLIRFRKQGWTEAQYIKMLPRLIEMCRAEQVQLMIDGEPDLLERFPVAGLHLNSTQLFDYTQRPISQNFLLAVSCHNQKELQQAAIIATDFAMLSPVLPTATHVEMQILGWNKFFQLVDKVNFPVYALGGMTLNQPAIWFGAQGVAGITLAKI